MYNLYNYTTVHGLTFSEGLLVQLILDIGRTLGTLLQPLLLWSCDAADCLDDAVVAGNAPGGSILLRGLRVPSQHLVAAFSGTPPGWPAHGGLQGSGPCCVVAPPGAHALVVGVLPHRPCVALVLFLLSSSCATFHGPRQAFRTLHVLVDLVLLVVLVHVDQVHLLAL